jgi:hypothetical protein
VATATARTNEQSHRAADQTAPAAIGASALVAASAPDQRRVTGQTADFLPGADLTRITRSKSPAAAMPQPFPPYVAMKAFAFSPFSRAARPSEVAHD